MALKDITIQFSAKGDDVLIKTIKALDTATKSLIKAQSALAREGKKQVQSQNKNKGAITRVNTALALQGSNWKKAGISAKLYTSAVKGNALALAKVRIATKKHISDLTRQRKGILDTAHSTRILGGSFAVLRSKLLLISFATTMVAVTFGKLVKAYAKQEKAEKKLSTVLKSTGHSAGLSHRQLLLMASSLQAVTTSGDEAIIEMQALMLTFTNINKDVFPQALESILNVSEAMGQDLQQSTIQIGKALNDPIQGMSALRRIGIQLSDTQKQQVKEFMAVNDVASAQKIIIEELDTQFGGMARSARLTLTGSLIALGNSWGDVMEKMGEKLAPFILALSVALEEMTFIMKSEGEKQLIFLEKAGASEETIRLARIRLLKEEAQERIKSAGAVDIDLNKTESLNLTYQKQKVLLVAMKDNLKSKETALAESSGQLLKTTESSKQFNLALRGGKKALNDYTDGVTSGGFSMGGMDKILAGTNLTLGENVVLDKESVEMQKEKIEKQVALNNALRDYLVSLELIADFTTTTTALGDAQIKTAELTKIAMSGISDAFDPDLSAGESLKRFMLSVIDLFQGVILASGAMAKAVALSFTPAGVPMAIASLVALEVAKVAVRNIKFAEHGFEGFVDKPTLFMTGEGNKREHVSITPLESPNVNGANGDGSIIVNIMGGIIQEDYITNELLPAINKAKALA